MIHVVLQKDVTLLTELSGGRMKVESCRYKDVEAKLVGQTGVIFSYPWGMVKRRVKFIEDLGFVWQSNIFYNTDALHAVIKQVWVRKQP